MVQGNESRIAFPDEAPFAGERTARRIGVRRTIPVARDHITLADLRLTCLLPAYTLLAWCVPERHWSWLSRRVLTIEQLFSGSRTLDARIAASGVQRLWGASPDAIAGELEAARIEHYFQCLRALRPGGWHPRITLEGRENLDAAMAGGRGVVLWVGHLVFNGLAPKMALDLAGYEVSHLSRPEHGFSKTTFGVRVLNPIRWRAENRYLARRILIRRGDEQRAVRAAHRILRSGGVVSITAGAWEGRRVAEVPLLDGAFPLATGAAALAHATGAALMPLFTVRTHDTSPTLRIVVDRPIDVDRRADRDDAITAALADYGTRLAPVVRMFPGQWRGWSYLRPRSAVPVPDTTSRAAATPETVRRLIRANSDDLRAAASRLAQMLEERPDQIEVAVALAELHYTLGDLDAAIATTRRAAALEPGHPGVVSLQVRERFANRDFDRARTLLQSMELSGVWRRSHVRAIASALARVEEYTRAAQLCRRLCEARAVVEDLLSLATYELKAGNVAEAARRAEQAIQQVPRGDQRYSALIESIARVARESSFESLADAFTARLRALRAASPDADARGVLAAARKTLEDVRSDPNVSRLRAGQPLKASLICPIHRTWDLDNAVARMSAQTWSNLEVIFAVNSPEITEQAIRSRWRSSQPLTVLDCTGALLGAVLNHAIEHSRGDVVLKIDADCFYGPRYCEDMLSALVHFNADIVSKKAKFRFFERSDTLVLEHPSFCFAPATVGAKGGGSAIAFHRRVFATIPFQTTAKTLEDVMFLRKAAASGYRHVFVDPFNHYSTRASDQSKHSLVIDDVLLCNGRPHALIGDRDAIARFVEA